MAQERIFSTAGWTKLDLVPGFGGKVATQTALTVPPTSQDARLMEKVEEE